MARIQSLAAQVVGARLLEALQVAGVSQSQLAVLSGIDTSNISKLERGAALPKPGSLVRLAATLGVDPGILIEKLSPADLSDSSRAFSAAKFLAEQERRTG